MIYSDELLAVAKRIFWFETTEETLEFPKHFLANTMTYASDEDIEILGKYFSNDDFKATLDDPEPGIFDRSSWAKWNERYNRTPVPPLPRYPARPSLDSRLAAWGVLQFYACRRASECILHQGGRFGQITIRHTPMRFWRST